MSFIVSPRCPVPLAPWATAEQVEILFDRDGERVGDDLGPVGIAIGRRRRQPDRLGTERCIGACDLDGFDGRSGDGVTRHLVRGREPPAPSARTRSPKPNDPASETDGTSTALPVADRPGRAGARPGSDSG